MGEAKVNFSWWDCLFIDIVLEKYQLIITMRMGSGIDEYNRKLPNNGKRKRNVEKCNQASNNKTVKKKKKKKH